MNEGRVDFRIGPVPSDMALAWIHNAQAILEAVSAYRRSLSIEVRDEVIELCSSLLDMWDQAARKSDTFEWSFAMSTGVVEGIIEQWLQVGALTDDELRTLGVSWAPEWTRPMAEALTAAVIAVLPKFDAATKRRFAERLERGAEPA